MAVTQHNNSESGLVWITVGLIKRMPQILFWRTSRGDDAPATAEECATISGALGKWNSEPWQEFEPGSIRLVGLHAFPGVIQTTFQKQPCAGHIVDFNDFDFGTRQRR